DSSRSCRIMRNFTYPSERIPDCCVSSGSYRLLCGAPPVSGSHPSRRDLLSTGAVLGSTLALGAGDARANSYSGEVPWAPSTSNAPEPITPGALQFFTPEEAAFIDAAVARIIPADELGPGAKEAGVTVFLDRQLAGAYGRADTWYMRGPWKDGEKTQGYQSRLTPAHL